MSVGVLLPECVSVGVPLLVTVTVLLADATALTPPLEFQAVAAFRLNVWLSVAAVVPFLSSNASTVVRLALSMLITTSDSLTLVTVLPAPLRA